MPTPYQSRVIQDALDGLIFQTRTCYKKGNIVGSQYLAMLVGLWMHTCKLQNSPPFSFEDENELFVYCQKGFYASEDAKGITAKIEQEQRKKEEKRIAKKMAEWTSFKQKEGKVSFWNKKIF